MAIDVPSDSNEADVEEGFVDISIEQDRSLLKKILEEGDPSSGTPVNYDDVMMHYDGRLFSDGTKFDSSRDRGFKQFQFHVGTGAHDGSSKFTVPRAWDVGVCTMHRREKCILRAKSNYAYGTSGQLKVPGNATVEFEVDLFNWQAHEYEPDEMDSNAERSAYALKHKEAGNEEIKAKEWAKAVKKYAVGINFVEFNAGANVSGNGGDIDGSKLSAEDKKLYVALLSNSAMALLKLDAAAGALGLCNKVLVVEPSNIKVLYRRAQAHTDIGEWALAIEDANHILALDSANAEAQKLRQVATVKMEASKKQQKAVYGKMFGGMS